MSFIILPNQLFDKKHLDKKTAILLWEHPHFFKDYNFNKKKLILHRASMKSYYDYLKKNKFDVTYYEFSSKNPLSKIQKYKMFDPINKLGTLKLSSYKNIEILDSPNFLLNSELYTAYRKKTDKFFFNGFYMWSKKQLDILPNVKSQDKENRKTMPKTVKIPPVPSNKKDAPYIQEATTYVNKHFPKNYGNVDNFIYPVSHSVAKKWLDNFIKKKFKLFGDYQDYIKEGESYMFHSLLSSSINIGLLNPIDVIETITKYKSQIPMNSYEGFIRQLFWREYQRFTYIYYDFTKTNYFGNKGKLNKKWYEGTLGIPPVDDAIKSGFDTGYLHHILRLMVVGNYMNLSGLSPMEGFKWFMEFSCDSYEWVMCQNVLDMVFFVSGGKTMRRPYISSSNYIIKMSDYKKGEWSEEWDKKYQAFTKKNRPKLLKYRYYFRNL